MYMKNLIFGLSLFSLLSTNAMSFSFNDRSAKSEQRRIESLKVYDDNRVGLSVYENPSHGIVAINTAKDKVFGVSVDNKIFNLLDVQRIEGKGSRVTVYLKSGEVHTGVPGYLGLAAKELRPDSPAFVLCTKDGRCDYRYQINGTTKGDDLDLLNFDLSSSPNYKPCVVGCFTKGMRGIPRTGTYTLFVMDGPTSKEIADSRIVSEEKAKRDYLEAEQRENEIRQLARVKADNASANLTEQMRHSIKTGTRTNCGVVIDVKKPLVLVETQLGQKYLEIDRLFNSGESCRFIDGVYVGR